MTDADLVDTVLSKKNKATSFLQNKAKEFNAQFNKMFIFRIYNYLSHREIKKEGDYDKQNNFYISYIFTNSNIWK